jgi:hypothetical protein
MQFDPASKRWTITLSTILCALLAVNIASAADWLHCWCCKPIRCCYPCCPDNYCVKPQPCPPCAVCCHGPDDYCCKPLPCTMPFCCFGCNDYCTKPISETCPCYLPPGSTCGPPCVQPAVVNP